MTENKLEEYIFCPHCGAWLNSEAKHRVMTSDKCYAINGDKSKMEIETNWDWFLKDD